MILAAFDMSMTRNVPGVQAGKGFKEAAEAAVHEIGKLKGELTKLTGTLKTASEDLAKAEKDIAMGALQGASDAEKDAAEIAEKGLQGLKQAKTTATDALQAGSDKLAAAQDVSGSLAKQNANFIKWQGFSIASSSAVGGGAGPASNLAGKIGSASNSNISAAAPSYASFLPVSYDDPIQAQNCASSQPCCP